MAGLFLAALGGRVVSGTWDPWDFQPLAASYCPTGMLGSMLHALKAQQLGQCVMGVRMAESIVTASPPQPIRTQARSRRGAALKLNG